MKKYLLIAALAGLSLEVRKEQQRVVKREQNRVIRREGRRKRIRLRRKQRAVH